MVKNSVVVSTENMLNESQVVDCISRNLQENGWTVKTSRYRGADIIATKDGVEWVIEAKGCGNSRHVQTERNNFFIYALGQILTRLDSDDKNYSVAFPDLPEFVNLWNNFSKLAKSKFGKNGLTILLVSSDGSVRELH